MIRISEARTQQLEQMRTQAEAGQIGFWQIYKTLADWLVNEYGASITDSSVLWLRGATEANAGRGAFSALIRGCTETQYQLRYGAPIPVGKLQEASNQVAKNLLDDISGRNPGWNRSDIPTIDRIAFADATAVGRVLFNANLQDTAAELQQNSAWSGGLLFSLLRSDQTGRLMNGGGDTRQIDTLNDWRDVLYAYKSYEAGLKAAVIGGAQTLALSQSGSPEQRAQAATTIATDTLVMGATLYGYVNSGASDVLGAILAGTPNPTLKAAFQTIGNMGANTFLDMLMGAVQGKSLLGATTNSNFASTAKAFFGALTPAQLQAIDAQRLPTDASAIAILASQDNAQGASARAALLAGSFIRTSISNELANSEALKPYDPVNKAGTLTEQWLQDRSLFVIALGTGKPDLGGQQWRSPHLPRDRSFEFQYVDFSGTPKTILAENTARPGGTTSPGLIPSQLIAFGGTGDDTLNGSGNKLGDRLYGGAGADTLDGKAGSDYLEGGADNDILRGGDNDQASDVLIGGKGSDTYQFSGLFGNDSITDSDGQGNITINGASLGSLTQVQNNVWENASKTLVFTQVISAAASAASGGQPVTNLIIGQRTDAGSGSVNATITINNWKDGDLGINLGTETKKIDNNGFVVADRTTKEGTKLSEGSFFGESQYWVRSKDGVSGPVTLDAGAGNDLISGNTQAETISGGAGHDFITGGGGKDVLLGGDGYDFIIADIDAKTNGGLDENGQLVEPPEGWSHAGIYSDTGDDNKFQGYGWAYYTKPSSTNPGSFVVNEPLATTTQSGDISDVFIDGGAGTDNLWAGAGNDTLLAGADVVGNNHDQLSGGYGNDLLIGNRGSNVLYGDMMYRAGTDWAKHGQDRLYAGAGDDKLFGGGNDDLLGGDAGKDILDGDGIGIASYGATAAAFHGKDRLDGGAGDDWLFGGGADDVLLGGEGNDRLEGDGSYYCSGLIKTDSPIGC